MRGRLKLYIVLGVAGNWRNKMALSNFEWIVVHDDGSSETVIADCIEEVLDKANVEAQPIAIIKGSISW